MRTHIVLPEDLVQRIDKLVGRRRRSSYIAEAAAEKLRHDALDAAFDKFAGSLADVMDELPPEWRTSEGASKWVHDLREADARSRDQRLRG